MSTEDLEEIGIVGIGCRFPGANDIREFWKLLENGENHVKDIPKDRWDNDKIYSEDFDEPGKIYVKKAGLLSEHDTWDNRLFGISDREAIRIDPQQRYVLECTHMALEDAGITRKKLSGTNTGVFIGVMNDDYKSLMGTDHSEDTNFTATGLSTTVMASRVSYVYNLHGPCMTIDTACSSAMMALHLGCQAIRAGECDIAICGGVSSILSPDMFLPLCKARMLSKIGQCQTFCDTADGYARSEGCGIIILKSMKMPSKIKNLWGILQTGINQDGRAATPMTAPSSLQQQELLHSVYTKYNVNPKEMDYVELHGTGTPIGDPTEVDAISTFIKSTLQTTGSNQSQKILMGSVKSNIGHTESAAAVAGIIKVLLMMRHGQIVKSLHIKEDKSNLNKRIKLDEKIFDIALRNTNWPQNELGNRVACVNSFGFGGSNGHAIIKQCSDKFKLHENEMEVIQVPIVPYFVGLFGRDKASLSKNVECFIEDTKTYPEKLCDISYTSLYHRDKHEQRKLLYGTTFTEIYECARSQKNSISESVERQKLNTVFVFCGVGTAWPKMGAEMMKKHAVFLQTVRKINEYLKEYSNCDVEEILNFTEKYDDPFLNHVAIFTVQVALYEMWKSFSIVPDVIIGQSVGEVAAAYSSGAIDLPSAVKIIYHRSMILAQKKGGAMTVIGNIPLNEIENICSMSKYHDHLNIAVYNSPSSCTVSGSENVVKDFEKEISSYDGAFIRSLKVICAYHSHLMDDCLPDISTALDGLKSSNESPIPQISTVTGQFIKRNELTSSEYWAQNVRQPVLFKHAVGMSTKDDSRNVFIEIGPRQVLRTHLPNILSDSQMYVCLPSMNLNDESCLYKSLATMYELGVDIDFQQLLPYKGRLASLPRYHFNRTNHLFMSSLTKQYLSGLGKSRGSKHYIEKVSEDAFNILINQESTPFVFDHKLLGHITIPGATYVEAIIASASEVLKIPSDIIEVSANFENPCMVEKGPTTVLHVSFKPNFEFGDKYLEYSISINERTLCTGHVNERKPNEYYEMDIKALKKRLTTYASAEEIFNILEKIGLTYGESLRLIQECFFLNGEGISAILIPACIRTDVKNYNIHPAIVDAMLQSAGVLSGNSDSSRSFAGIPKGFRTLKVFTSMQEKMFVYTKLTKSTRINSFYTSLLCTEKGTIIAEMVDLTIRSIDASIPNDEISYELKWYEYKMTKDILTKDANNEELIVIGSEQLKCWLSKGNISFTFFVIPSDQTQLKHVLIENLKKSKKQKKIIFGPCCNINHFSIRDNVEIYNITKYNANLLKAIFNIKQSIVEYTVSVIVITEMTQPLTTRTPLEKANFLGAELWGFTRSAMAEMPSEDIRLIDVDLKEESVQSFVSLVIDTETKVPESLIRNGCIYINEIRSSITQDITTIQSNLAEISVPLNLYSKYSNEVLEPFLALTNTKFNANRVSAEQKRIKVSTVYVNCDNRFRTNQSIPLDNNFTSQQEITANEFIGWVLRDNAMQKDEEYQGVCFPVTVSTVVTVPSCCCFNLNDIPSYTPGLISEMMTIWKVRKAIKENSNTLIVTRQNSNWRAHLLSRLLEHRKCKGNVACWKELHSLASSGEKFSHAVLMEFENAKSINMLNGIIGLQQVITVNSWVPWNQLAVILQNKLCARVVVLQSEDILTEKYSIKCVPKILKYLKTDSNVIENILPKRIATYRAIDIQNVNMETKIPVILHPTSFFRKDGFYIFVGGTSGLGWELLQYCAELGAGNLVTISRRGITKEKKAEIESVENIYRCNIQHIRADVTDIDSLKNGLNILRNNFDNVKGIFNGAGVLKDTLLTNMTTEDIETALRPKVLGTLNLHTVSKDLSLDFFITHSSITSIIGNPGQCNYAAGNSFQDSFAYFRASCGLNAQSINWGALPFGMARESGPDFEKRFRRQGIHVLNDTDVKTCFNEMLLTKDIQKIFGIFDWQRFIQNPIYSSTQQKFRNMIHATGLAPKANHLQSANIKFIGSEFNTLPLEKKKEHLSNILMSTLKESLMVETESLNSDTSLYKLGIDSMSAMSISNSLHQYTSVRVPVVFLLSNTTTLEGLIAYVLTEYESRNENGSSNNEEPIDTDILNGSVTFMQAQILKHLDTEEPQNFIRSICYEIKSRRIGTKKWTHIIMELLKIHSGLRQIFVRDPNDDSFQMKEIRIDKDNAPIDIVPFETIFKTSTIDKLDPRNHIPVKFHIACKGRVTRMKLFLHAVVVDMQSIHLLFRDLERCTRHYLLGENPPDVQSVDVAEAVRIALSPLFKGMQSFWKQQLSIALDPFSFSESISNSLAEEKWREIGHLFSDSQFDDIIYFIRKVEITLYNFVLSVYFLCIYELTGHENIPLITNTNIRGFIPALGNVLTRCINEVPVIGKVNSKMTISEYLRQMALQLNMITENGAYPFELIKREMKSENLQQHIGRHRFIIDDISNVTMKSVKKDVSVKITAVQHRRHNYETCLFIYHDTNGKTLSLDLGFNSEALCTSSADHIIGRLESLMNQLTSCDLSVSVEEILEAKNPMNVSKIQGKDTFNLEDILGKSRLNTKISNYCMDGNLKDLDSHVGYVSSKTVMSGSIEKQSTVGNVYVIEAALKEMKTFDSTLEYHLCWTYFNKPRHICLESITEMHLKKMGGRYCILLRHDDKGWLQFNTKTYSQAMSWFEQLKAVIKKS